MKRRDEKKSFSKGHNSDKFSILMILFFINMIFCITLNKDNSIKIIIEKHQFFLHSTRDYEQSGVKRKSSNCINKHTHLFLNFNDKGWQFQLIETNIVN